ncbi:MAG: RagB/SusD family nutrient uptake outer membrane protein [Bacteroidales bacterium]|nr:RagB/SusD family nutrient uptake outer membrane protein [Bacteroidales bacterium]
MKKIYYIAIATALLTLSACDKYFDIDFQDQANLVETFSKKNTTERYLAHLYSYLPHDEDTHNGTGYVIPRSDEGLFGFLGYGPFNKLRSGDYSTAAQGDVVQYNVWKQMYIAIRQCTIFMDNVYLDAEDSDSVKAAMKAEARFLRAFYYFCLFRQYGPVIIWGDQLAPEDADGSKLDRNTVDENIDFIVEELDKAAKDLPNTLSEIGANDSWTGRATKGAAMALKSRVLLYAASPLYNGQDGGTLATIFAGKKNLSGKRIFSDYDGSKWQAAADAAKAVIDMGTYSLCQPSPATGTDERTDIQKAASAYQNVFFERWNTETIWGWWHLGIGHNNDGFATWIGATGSFMYATVPDFPEVTTSYRPLQAYTPSLKMADAYPMAESGRYPVLGYQKNGRLNDLSKPIVDAASGYSTTGWVDAYKQPVDADWAPAFKAHKTTVGRDARFYSSLVPDGFYWPSDKIKKRWLSYKSTTDPQVTVPVTKYESAALNWVGYACRRWYKANTAFATGADFTGAQRYVYPAFRLAEIYLNYAEACNEKPERDVETAITYLDKVRERSGLKSIRMAYPEINFNAGDATTTISGVSRTNKEWLRWLIHQERWCEFGMEAMRHYDMCRWMRAEDEYPCAPWTLNMKAESYDDLYTRVSTIMPMDNADFHYRDYFYPIISTQLSEMVNFTQNPGWE